MIRPRSTKMQKLMRAYNKDVKEWLLSHSRIGSRHGLENHHIRGRLGTLLFDKRFWLAVDRTEHNWIRDNPDKARKLGLLCERGDWNKIPDDDVTKRIRERMAEICKT